MKDLEDKNSDLFRLIREYEGLQVKLEVNRKKLSDAFYPLVDEAFGSEGEQAAFNVAKHIPCSVIRAFALDRIRYVLPNK